MPTPTSISDFLSAIAVRGRSIVGIKSINQINTTHDSVVELCHQLLSSKGEASGIALSNEILKGYRCLEETEKTAFFQALCDQFSADGELVEMAANNYLNHPSDKTLMALSDASEPVRRELIIRLNQAPNATQLLVDMRGDLLNRLPDKKEFRQVDRDFSKLFTSWFNGGFLQLRNLDWTSPASVLENIIRYEAVHGMSGWDDLRERIDPPDRLIYGFFHPRLNDEPLIFIEVALMREMPSQITTILEHDRDPIEPAQAKTAVFYSISNCQKGLRGIPLGSFLIKRVVEDLQQSFPQLREFVTLSPVPGLANWLDNTMLADDDLEEKVAPESIRELLLALKSRQWIDDADRPAKLKNTALAAAAHYLTGERDEHARPIDPVARFHLGNGARLERINWPADLSEQGLANSHGVMVNYQYRPEEIEKNHEKFIESGAIITSPEVSRLARNFRGAQSRVLKSA